MTREQVVTAMIEQSRSLFARNYTYSTGGNVSHRLGDGFVIEATNTSFGRLGPGDFADCDLDGRAVGDGPMPSKEAPFHAAVYRRRPEARAVLHLHAPGAIALSCLAAPTDEGNVLPVITSGSITRVGRVPLLEYIPPGAPRLAARIAEVCGSVNAVLMQNHGLLTYAPTLAQAVDIAEEFEQNVRVWLATGGSARVLDDAEVAAATPLFGAAIAPGTQRPVLLPGAASWSGARW